MKIGQCIRLLFFLVLFLFALTLSGSETGDPGTSRDVYNRIDSEVQKLLDRYEEVPGLSIAVVNGDDPVYVKGFGYADLEKGKRVTPETLFELASCSKAFTALAVAKLEQEGLIRFDDPVSKHLPWFKVKYEDGEPQITIRQLLHHTSGVPSSTISRIPEAKDEGALEETVKTLVDIELNNFPGRRYEYATINYDVAALVVQEVSGMVFEDYMHKHILQPLGLNNTYTGVGKLEAGSAAGQAAKGYKIGFFEPRLYAAPVFRGNNGAGYIYSNGTDMGRWLQLQLGLVENPLSSIIDLTHRQDQTVVPDLASLTAYAMGWQVSFAGNGIILHTGLNPNFTSIVLLQPQKKFGVAVMGNSNSQLTSYIGRTIMNALDGVENPVDYTSGRGIDTLFSVVSYGFIFYLILTAAFLILMIIDIVRKRRRFEGLSLGKLGKLVSILAAFVPFIYGIYLLPTAALGFTWKSVLVWGPKSLPFAILMLLAAIGSNYIAYTISILFPHQNKYFRSAPLLIILSFLTGGSNAVVIFLITTSLYANVELIYLLYYFGLAMGVYILGRKVVQTRLVKLTLDIVYDLRIKLIEKTFATSFQKFERIDSGRFIATLNNDTSQISTSANLFVGLITSFVTITGAFLYLATIAFWATLVTVVVVSTIATLYYIVSRKANALFEDARDTQNVYLGLLNGIVDGFKELSLRQKRKNLYKKDVEDTSDEFRVKSGKAIIKFINAFIIGETMLIAVLGTVGFVVPIVLPDITLPTLMSFIMVLLYLIGPVNGILNTMPQIMQIRIAWNRIKEFQEDIPANIDAEEVKTLKMAPKDVHAIEAKNVVFRYRADDEVDGEALFSVGPLDFSAEKGEIIFIVGGNGSGKTTLAKLLTGLYIPDEGTVRIDGEEVNNYQLGEYFSVVFGDYHLFEKLYDIDVDGREDEVQDYLELLRIQDKVALEEESFSTIDLSAGQRKRLALLRCYLEGSPIYLFDELAADQDPEFRKFFYRDLLQRMKESGKIVIAITHDDHYFDVADRVIKMDMGQIDTLAADEHMSVTR